jgi:anti-sigma-K factor RskA
MDELALETALAVLESPLAELEGRLAGADEATSALRRSHLEAIALLAWSLPTEPATAAGREKLLARLQGDETVMVERPRLASPAAPAAAASPLGALDPAAAPPPPPLRPASEPVARRPAPVAAVRAPRSYRWALPLAAAFALAVLGIAWHDRQLDRELEHTRAELAAARRDGAQLAERLREAGSESALAAATEDRMREMRESLALVTAGGTAVCAMRPSPGSTAPESGGVLFVAEDHQHWYLRAQKLPHPGEGRVYQLWFLVGDKPVAAGVFEMVGDEAVMSAPTMPHGTTAAIVTVEPAGQTLERPSGPVALYGRHMAPLL